MFYFFPDKRSACFFLISSHFLFFSYELSVIIVIFSIAQFFDAKQIVSNLPSSTGYPTCPFTNWEEPQDQENGEIYVAQKRRTTFEAQNLWKGCQAVLRKPWRDNIGYHWELGWFDHRFFSNDLGYRVVPAKKIILHQQRNRPEIQQTLLACRTNSWPINLRFKTTSEIKVWNATYILVLLLTPSSGMNLASSVK